MIKISDKYFDGRNAIINEYLTWILDSNIRRISNFRIFEYLFPSLSRIQVRVINEMKFRLFLYMCHVESKPRSPGQIIENICEHLFGLCFVKNKSTGHVQENLMNTLDATFLIQSS